LPTSGKKNLEKWTYTTNGSFGDKNYYERIDHNGNPDDDFQREFHEDNRTDRFWERDIVDAGFLELVRLGVKPPNDPKIDHSLRVIDAQLKVITPGGDMWHRYNHDSYGEHNDTGQGWMNQNQGRGRLWPLLSGERGEYELANGRKNRAIDLLKTMASAANDGFMIPEQCWDREDAFGFTFGKGTGSASPLAWSMAQFVRLALSIDAGFPVETPQVVADRYGGGPLKTGTITFNVTVPAGTDTSGKFVYLTGELNKLDPTLPLWKPKGLKLTRVDTQLWQCELKGPLGTRIRYKYTLGDWGSGEKGAGGVELPNRTLTILFEAAGRLTVKDTVVKWRDLPP
jgi:glucoamylase